MHGILLKGQHRLGVRQQALNWAFKSGDEFRGLALEQLLLDNSVAPRDAFIANPFRQVLEFVGHRFEAAVVQRLKPQQLTERQALRGAQLFRQQRTAGQAFKYFNDGKALGCDITWHGGRESTDVLSDDGLTIIKTQRQQFVECHAGITSLTHRPQEWLAQVIQQTLEDAGRQHMPPFDQRPACFELDGIAFEQLRNIALVARLEPALQPAFFLIDQPLVFRIGLLLPGMILFLFGLPIDRAITPDPDELTQLFGRPRRQVTFLVIAYTFEHRNRPG